MALTPGSEERDLSLPDDYKADHPQEHPEDWGWHADLGGLARFGGVISIIALLLMMTSTHYNGQGTLFLGLFAALLLVLFLVDRRRRKNSWRK